ncbi:MAG: GTPase Era [Alphaproteobacteria bacterium]|nr:GTPase Era [Alphaproteobacteria bacterium]
MKQTRCGFIAILGAPNAGKSTLINQLVGHKVTIVSSKVQTTRQRILGITIHEDSQLILVDTPGIFAPQKRLERAMVQAAWEASRDADITTLLVDVSQKSLASSFAILEKLNTRQVILVLNKIDQVKHTDLLEITAKFQKFSNITHTFMISALTGDGVGDFANFLASELPLSPWLYPEDQLTDMPQKLWSAEITREQLFQRLHHELPYNVMVETEAWEEFENGTVKVNQVIYVTREGQKAIVLGKGGHQIKAISSAAREEMSIFLNRTVHLFLHVKVLEDWTNKPAMYRLMGLDFNV